MVDIVLAVITILNTGGLLYMRWTSPQQGPPGPPGPPGPQGPMGSPGRS